MHSALAKLTPYSITFMKNQHLKVLLALFLLSFKTIGQSKTDSSFVINGSINANGGIVQLLCKNPIDSANNSKPMKVYSAEITNGTFTIKGDLDFPAMYAFRHFRNDSLLYSSDYFLVDAGTQKAEIQLDNNMPKLLNASMNHYYTTKSYSMNTRYQRDKKWFRAFADSLKAVYPTQMPDSLANVLARLEINQAEREVAIGWRFYEEMKDSYFALWLLFDKLHTRGFKSDYIYYYSYFSKELQQTDYGKLLQLKILEASPTRVAAKLPLSLIYRNLKTDSCEAIRLKANYTLMYYWRSSCGICIKQIPEFQQLYTEYSGKGFEIIHISDDLSLNLPFLEKIRKKYNIEWTEYLDENAVNEEDTQLGLYYPRTLLVDKDGVILKRTVSMDELKSFLKETLN